MEQVQSLALPQVRALFAPLAFHRAVGGVFAGTVPAKVYVDDPAAPRAGLIWNRSRVYLASTDVTEQSRAALRQLLVETICPALRAEQAELFLLYYAPEAWATQIDTLTPGCNALRVERQYYEYSHSMLDWRGLLPADYTLCLVDQALLDRTDLGQRAALMEEMCSERPSVADFLARSFGVCLVHGDEIVGWCLSEYNDETGCEVGIATLEPHQRRVLATVMATALVEMAHARGLTHVGWDCFARNQASVATAHKAGFAKVRDYTASVVWLATRQE